MKKVIFNSNLTEDNKRLRNYVLRTIKKYKKIKECILLEIGVGNGRFGFLIGSRFKKYYGIEPDEEYLKIAKKNLPKNLKPFYKKGIAEKIPFKKKFDIIFYAFSWHFIKNFEKALKEANRILKNDGIILIIDPVIDSKGWADPKLRLDSGKFDKKLYEKKMKNIQQGIKVIDKQKIFEIKEFNSAKINLWVLEKK